MSAGRIGWYIGAAGAATASVRLRCLIPMAELRQQGRHVEVWRAGDKGGSNQRCAVVIFSKIYDDRALQAAAELRAQGSRIVLDLCDNHWFGEDHHPGVAARAARLTRMIAVTDLVVASTPLLATQIANRFRVAACLIRVVPDPVLPPQYPSLTLKGRWDLIRLRRFLTSFDSASHLIWFGNQGAGHVRSGMDDLDRIRSVVDASGNKFTLTVVSNSKSKFRRLFGQWRTSMFYVPWRLDTVDRVLSYHDAAVIPISSNEFTAAKTMNRPATALMAGLDVFADGIPSYDELAPFITLDDWTRLSDYIPGRANAQNDAAREYLQAHYSTQRISALWADVVDHVLS